MIKTKKELRFYIMADMMMNRGKYKWNLKDRIFHLIVPDYIMCYLKSLRYCQYYIDNQTITPPTSSYPSWRVRIKLLPLFIFHWYRYKKLGLKLGFSIGCRALGYGVVIPHHGTIVVGGSNQIGNYAVLHTSTCISDNGKKIGNGLYLSTGAKITRKVRLGDNVSVAANSVVNNDFSQGSCLLAGMPAIRKCDAVAWYIRDGESYTKKVEIVEALRLKMNL